MLGIHHVKTLYTFPFWVYIKHVVKVVFDILKIKVEREEQEFDATNVI